MLPNSQHMMELPSSLLSDNSNTTTQKNSRQFSIYVHTKPSVQDPVSALPPTNLTSLQHKLNTRCQFWQKPVNLF